MGSVKEFLKYFIEKADRWSIGIYAGDSPYHFQQIKDIKNPVLTAKHVTDRKAVFVADPFMVNEQGVWYMFFEVLDRATQKGEIGLAVSEDGFHWSYQQIVLTESFHLSYPYVFKWENEYYMIPESHTANSIRLYRAIDFPFKWSYVTSLLTGYFSDSSVFYYSKKWWMFTVITPEGKFHGNDHLLLYHSDDLLGPWLEHPSSAVVKNNPHIARPGGRVLLCNGKVVRYSQDCSPSYGAQVFAFEIAELTNLAYAECLIKGNPILKPSGKGWNKNGMHNIDPHQIDGDRWIACVDGNAQYLRFKNKEK